MEDMTSSASRKLNKVFLKMSRVVGTRSADQCRSHHQKILKYHTSLQHIVSSYKRRFSRREQEADGTEGNKKQQKTH